MSLDLQIYDISGASPEHSIVITNFVTMIHTQLKDSTCRVFPNNVEYRWKMDYGSKKIPKYFLIDTITKENCSNLHLMHFPHIIINFERLFDGIE